MAATGNAHILDQFHSRYNFVIAGCKLYAEDLKSDETPKIKSEALLIIKETHLRSCFVSAFGDMEKMADTICKETRVTASTEEKVVIDSHLSLMKTIFSTLKDDSKHDFVELY
jgi:hypothetical protein